MQLDIEQARAHIAAIKGSPDALVTLQTFTDANAPDPDPLAQIRHGTITELWPWVEQQQRAGAGVFITVNDTDGKGRSKANIVRTRAVWADDDAPRDAPRTDWPTAPTLVVETSPGKFHYYWRTE